MGGMYDMMSSANRGPGNMNFLETILSGMIGPGAAGGVGNMATMADMLGDQEIQMKENAVAGKTFTSLDEVRAALPHLSEEELMERFGHLAPAEMPQKDWKEGTKELKRQRGYAPGG